MNGLMKSTTIACNLILAADGSTFTDDNGHTVTVNIQPGNIRFYTLRGNGKEVLCRGEIPLADFMAALSETWTEHGLVE